MSKSIVKWISAMTLLLAVPGRTQETAWAVHPSCRSHFSAVLMWHDVVVGKKDVWFDTTEKELSDQFAELKHIGANVIPLEQMRDHLLTGKAIPSRATVLTFDDNTLGIYKYAFPLIKKYRFPAVLFVHTDFVGVRTVKDHCNWEQLKEMVASGLVTVQSHTLSHPSDMRLLNDKQLKKELVNSKAVILHHLGTAAYAFAYTEGKFNDRVRRATMAAGYELAFTEERGSAGSSPDRSLVRRFSMHRRVPEAMAAIRQDK